MDIKTVDNKKANYFKQVKSLYILLMIYAGVSLYSVSKLMSVLFCLSALFMWFALKTEAKRIKVNKPYIEDTFIEVIKIKGIRKHYVIVQLFVPAFAMFLLFASEIIGGPVVTACIHLGVVSVGILYCAHLLRRIASYETLMFDKGLYHHMVYYSFDQINKHQFIPLKKGGYLLEINNGKNLASFKINDDIHKKLTDLML